MTTLREFTTRDWYVYDGAENFEDNTVPMVKDDEEDFYTIIIDRNSIEVHVEEEDNKLSVYNLPLKAGRSRKLILADRLVEEFKDKFPLEVHELLNKYGFLEL